MIKKYVIFFALCAYTYAMPPVLKRNTTSVCWNNAALQLLLIFEPFNKKLIDDKHNKTNKYYNTGDGLQDVYIDFIDAVNQEKQTEIDNTQKTLYSSICAKKNVKEGKEADPRNTLETIYYAFKDLFDTTLASYWQPHGTPPLWKKEKMYFLNTTPLFFNDIVDWTKQYAAEKQDPTIINTTLPEYVVLKANAISQKNHFVDCNKKSYPFEKWYDLIGYMSASNKNGGHFWTWIKNRETDTWYIRDDLKPKDTDLHTIAVYDCPHYYVYKKIPGAIEKELYEKAVSYANQALDALSVALINI